jgi:hypothetical protein
MSVGFTGTRRGMTMKQRTGLSRMLHRLFRGGHDEFRHGACVGADCEAARLARSIGFKVIAHPSTMTETQGNHPSHATLPQKHPLARNRDIVRASTVLVATPKETEEVRRSGTWMTIRAARKKGIPVHVIAP